MSIRNEFANKFNKNGRSSNSAGVAMANIRNATVSIHWLLDLKAGGV